ncbi:class I SAM-dependent RNA methyltransferase [Oricola cellulosilytica]|uniref:Class I SAM-dependent RNA methyltransferase n=1 Tax=Oricola cellulosilytica TaxID=1429082 RepID=A0A4R0P8P1_9HYPH|nr:class I SAM-dependent RNA methyltransferase [Oricola cellulosilytica]TCD13444.1 class I SAM-dependent RNA methyltransferase [Oricola cellulosilytica]
MSRTVTLQIGHLGARGDGVSSLGDAPVFVPFTLPGEEATIVMDGRSASLLSISDPSADRVEPVCPHFGTCGGCALQHMALPAYRAWKASLFEKAFASRNLDTSAIKPAQFCEPHTRRRAVFSAIRTDAGVQLGFLQAGSNRVVDLRECHVISPAIDAGRPKLKALTAAFLPPAKTVHVTVNETVSGLDIAVDGKFTLGEGAKRRAADALSATNFVRLTVNGEIVLELKRPLVKFGDIAVSPPPGAFLQAVPAMEESMAALVCDHMAKSKRVADLYAGCGTFAVRIAKASTVHVVEADGAALRSLDRGVRDAGGFGLRQVTTEKRDLARRPLTAQELKPFDGVVFDPPRAGAEAQTREIAASTVQRVAAVSCNPETLARDLRILVDAGFRLRSVTPIDQFIWTPHLEAVALLDRLKSAKRHWSDL